MRFTSASLCLSIFIIFLGCAAACSALPSAPSVPSAPTMPNAASLTSGVPGADAGANPLSGRK